MSLINRNVLFFGLFTLVLLCLAYSNHFHNGFHFDDWHTIEDNLYIRNIANIPAFFHDPKMFSVDPDHWGLRPIVTTTLAIDYWLAGGLKPFYFHLSIFIWFILLGLMIYFVFKNLLKQSINHIWVSYIAMFAASWFLLNTINAETINYIISRSDVLSTFFIVASFLIFINYPQKRKYYIYILPAFLGVFVKEVMPVLIIILFFYILLFENQLSISDLFKKTNFKLIIKAITTLLPLTIVIAVTQFYTMSADTAILGVTNPFVNYVFTQTYVWLHYFISFFNPTNVSADTDLKVFQNLLDDRVIIGFAFIAVYVWAIFKTSKKSETKPIAFGLIWFGATLLPTSLAPLAEVTNDHRMFLPFIGLSLSITTSISLFIIKRESKINKNSLLKIGVLSLGILILSLNAYGVYQRNKVWKTEASLWYDVTQKSPGNGRGFMNYGLTQMEIGNYEDAIYNFEKAKVLTPNYNAVYINLGIAKNAIGNPEEAEQEFKKSISLSPNTFNSYLFYAKFLYANNRLDEAKINAEKALSLNPTSSDIYEELLKIYNQQQDWVGLEKTAKDYLVILPDNELAKNYLEASLNKTPYQTKDEAKQSKSIITDYINKSLVFYNEGKYQECINICKKVLEINPNQLEAYINIGAANNMLKNWEESIKFLNKALELDPTSKLAIGNLNWAKTELEKLNKK